MNDSDLVVVGGGPAGCAAAVMASSLGLRCGLIEPHALGYRVDGIAAIDNVLGGSATGRELAWRIAADVANARTCTVLLGVRATAVRAADDAVTVELSDGGRYRAPYAVVATGTRPLRMDEVDWIHHNAAMEFPAVWRARPADLAGVDSVVLGADRPLGTVLRAHPIVPMRLLVLYPPGEQYKADEVADDPRVTLAPVDRLDLARDPRVTKAGRVLLNLGSRPVVPDGDLVPDASGYCPPSAQHPRILVAGDLRGARYQRIMAAFGSGAEAALTAYYSLRGVG